MFSPLVIFIGIIVILILSGVKILKEYERGVVFRLGRIVAPKGPGFNWIIPIVDKMVKISLRVITMDVPPQDIITKDNVSVKVNAVVYFRVVDPVNAVIQVENYLYATSQLAQTTLRSILGTGRARPAPRREGNPQHKAPGGARQAHRPLGNKSHSRGGKIRRPPSGDAARDGASQAEAERERRAKVIAAEGEYQAATRLADASDILSRNPMSLQLRYLQTLLEMSSEKNTTIVFPLPIDLITPLLRKLDKPGSD